MEKKRKPSTLTDEKRVEILNKTSGQNPPIRRTQLTPEEEKHWAEVRAKIAEARAKGEL